MLFEDILVPVPNNCENVSLREFGGFPIPFLPKEKNYPHEGLINPYTHSKKMINKFNIQFDTNGTIISRKHIV